MKIPNQLIIFIVAFVLLPPYVVTNFCYRPNYELFDDMYMSKDTDMCTMFMQSYIDSVDMKISVKDYLMKYLPYKYLSNGHLHSFTEYRNKNYTFLLTSAIDQNQENFEKVKYQFQVDNGNDNKKELHYISINWDRKSSDILDDIRQKFKIIEQCNSTITFYLTFPSYPENSLLLKFFENFQKKLNIPINDPNALPYRHDIDPSFLSMVDSLPLVIFQQLLRQHHNVRIVLCGHGFGGTIAQLSTLHILSKEANLHYTQLRSITLGALFFARKQTIDYIENHHVEKHFINIYHEMDVIPSLFNMAELLSQSASMKEQVKIIKAGGGLWATLTSWLPGGGNKIMQPQSHLKHLITWLCHSLTAYYSSLSSTICQPFIVDTAFDFFKKSLGFIQSSLHEGSIPQLIYRPVGIYNLITFRKYDQTWHLVNVINTEFLNENLHATLELSRKTDQIFQNHSISSYIMGLRRCNQKEFESTKVKTLSNVLSSSKSNEHIKNSDKNLNHSVIIPLPFSFSNHLYDRFRSGASYTDMIALPPAASTISNSTSMNDIIQKFLSTIKYRTGLMKMKSNIDTKKHKLSSVISVYDACLAVYETYGVDARMELMKLQLEQRMLVPILVSNDKRMSLPFRSYIKTLSLVEVPALQSQENHLASDTKLLRIGLISTIQKKNSGLPGLIENLFQTFSIRQSIPGTGTGIKSETIAEIGYGFLPNSSSSLSHQPVIITHIIGNFHPLLSFLVQYVDVLIVEYNEDDLNFARFEYNRLFDFLRIQNIMIWKHTIDADFNEVTLLKEPFAMNIYEGNSKAVTDELQKELLRISRSKVYIHSPVSSRPCLVDIIKDINLFIDDDIAMLDTDNLFKNIDTIDLKRNQFKFQHSYKEEAKFQLEKDNPLLQLNDNRRKELEEDIRQERHIRVKGQKDVSNIPLLKSYLAVIDEINDEKRYIHKRQFESALVKLNEEKITPLRQKREEAFIEMNQATQNTLQIEKDSTDYLSSKEKQSKAIHKLSESKQNLINASLSIDHFWREISHLYITNKTLYQTLPDLAAQHLIDGFSLELLDGDSMLLNMQWIEPVFDSLSRKLYKELDRQARILVLSICGPQSSGKSTLLKTMYGIRIRSSVGACTQGVNMMLIKILYQDYDYVLLFDTEGLRAPEFSFLPDAHMRDNTLATFAVLPADGTILLNKGEVNQALEDVLPIVLYLYATSALSMQLGGQTPSKLFFVYNQIDPSQQDKGTELLQDLSTRLHDVTNKIREGILPNNTVFNGFEQCRIDLKNSSNSDFRILSINTNNPPINHPVDLFGEDCLRLRQWIGERITNKSEIHPWKARSISDIFDYIKVVSDMIRQARHITSLSTSLEMLANNKLNEEIERIKYNVSSNFTIIRTRIENEIIQNHTNSPEMLVTSMLSFKAIENITQTAHNMVLNEMQETILNADIMIFKLTEGKKRQSWIRDDWQIFLHEKRIRNRQFLATRIEREITNYFFIERVGEKIRQDFIQKCNKITCTDLDDIQRQQIFNETLQNRIREFLEPYHSGIIEVTKAIKEVYNRSIIIQNVKIFDDKEFCDKNGFFERSSNGEDDLQHIQNSESKKERLSREYRYKDETQKFNQATDEIKSYINNLIRNYDRYDPLIVNEVLQRLHQIIYERSAVQRNTIQDIHRGTYCYLSDQLIYLQNTWDAKHNRTKLLEDNRTNLWKFFLNVVNGIRGIKLFELELYNQIKSSWNVGFIEHLIRDVKTQVAKQPWIGNSDILSAYIDNEKIEILEKQGITELFKKIDSAGTFYENCMIKFVQAHIDDRVKSKWEIFYEHLHSSIKYAGDEAKNSPKNCLEVFLQTLHNQSLPFAIISRLPRTTKAYGNVDDQPRNIFDGVVTTVQSAILKLPGSLLYGNESKIILEELQKDPLTDDAKPRCNHACRLCGAPCYKHAGHSGHHDFHHQPGGLSGLRTRRTHLIVHRTCHQNYMENRSFSIDHEHFHPYTEFPNILNSEIPHSQSRRSRLGEYLMNKYHDEIANYYELKPNPPVPVAYSEHTLEDIKATIKKLIDPTSG
ncbi:unnamed protein product [Adineta steineri]|uniref:VLIG-type G domain-containing protein n=1 Tax=Adineta steineri TaxID=433720 RepID=A0A815Z459_9BILA|nr:unnamed protein product [Adineta steineri]CAF1579870.1 unnamed protein product [Adineta steineri]